MRSVEEEAWTVEDSTDYKADGIVIALCQYHPRLYAIHMWVGCDLATDDVLIIEAEYASPIVRVHGGFRKQAGRATFWRARGAAVTQPLGRLRSWRWMTTPTHQMCCDARQTDSQGLGQPQEIAQAQSWHAMIG